MKHVFPSFRSRRNERGVALIIVLGFLGLMVMMAVAFMVQARVERMVADTTLDSMRARQIAQTGIAAAIQDYMNDIKAYTNQADAIGDMFLSGDFDVDDSGYCYSDPPLYYGSTNLWNGNATNWLPKSILDEVDINRIKKMEWTWVRQKPNSRSRILGRYAYVCFNLSGGVDANLLGRGLDDRQLSEGYGAQTNRGNVRKMSLDAIKQAPSKGNSQQQQLSKYQKIWGGFDTPVALDKLTNGKNNDKDGDDLGYYRAYKQKTNRPDIDENKVHELSREALEHLSCYSYAATHRGADYGEKKPCTVENIVGNQYFSRLVTKMGGNEAHVHNALLDYFSSPDTPPQGTDYPSVKAVPMFNEIWAKVELEESVDAPGGVQIKVTIKPEFWCPVLSEGTPASGTYTLEAPKMGGGNKQVQNGDTPIWIYARIRVQGGYDVSQVTFEQSETPEPLTFEPNKGNTPQVPGEFVYKLNFNGLPKNDEDDSVIQLSKMQMQVQGVYFREPWELKAGAGKAVDATPSDKPLQISISPPLLSYGISGNKEGSGSREVDDPRLNHLAGRWPDSGGTGSDTLGEKNSCLDKARNDAKTKMGYEPGNYMYCRNGKMLSPAELGYIPIYDGTTPWMTLDIFSENGVNLMNTLVCDDDTWKIIDKYDIFYTNGTINPYTRDVAVFNGAFYGLDIREVPNMSGTPTDAQIFGKDRVVPFAEQLVKEKTPDGEPFVKDGPGGWTRLLSYPDSKVFNGAAHSLNKNERVALAHNTWGLFNESDTLFLVFVVAQSITEAPEKVNPVGDWNEKEDMITGERWAVALCWMDTSKEGSADEDDLTQEMDIIMFKYLNE